ncbi:hypothetical protein DPMN_137583 [Dreissena polymorpha]|uniref:Uncharacterized protein n=1 Tax=Dreissena polymorpha TaxID=45954 RepID=A0A9D4G849_DREPO|nr:hypothetical protein DPMN_137583 [Dreissena polymorpha]
MPYQDLGLLPEYEFQQVHLSLQIGLFEVSRCGVLKHGTSPSNGNLEPSLDGGLC